MILYLQSTRIQPLSCLHFLVCLKIETEQKSKQWLLVMWKHTIPSCILKNECHPHSCTLEERFCSESKANNWCLSGKSLWRSNHFPWGCFFLSGWAWAGGHLVTDEPSAWLLFTDDSLHGYWSWKGVVC